MGIRELGERTKIEAIHLRQGQRENPSIIAGPPGTENAVSNVGTENPVQHAIGEAYGPAGDMDHAYPNVNRFKVVELALVNAGLTGPPAPDAVNAEGGWGNWRTRWKENISNNVLLYPEEKVFNFAYTNNYGKAWEALSGGAMGKVMQLGEMLRVASAMAGNPSDFGGKFVSAYKEAPTWLSTLPLEFANSLKFNFQFGQAGMFSAEYEVVRPIIQLARLFLPVTSAGVAGGSNNYFQGPVPTPPSYLANFMTTFFSGNTLTDIKTGFDNLETIKEQSGPGGIVAGGIGTLANGVTALENALLNAKDTAIRNTLAQTGQNRGGLCIRMGRLAFGPFLVKNVSWNFDFTQVDEYGFPYKGSLTYSGLESIIMPNHGQMNSMFPQGHKA